MRNFYILCVTLNFGFLTVLNANANEPLPKNHLKREALEYIRNSPEPCKFKIKHGSDGQNIKCESCFLTGDPEYFISGAMHIDSVSHVDLRNDFIVKHKENALISLKRCQSDSKDPQDNLILVKEEAISLALFH